MTERIRWHEEDYESFIGYIGNFEPWAYQIWKSGEDWSLMSQLPGDIGRSKRGSLAELKAEAERWLAEFASSLGAIFPDALRVAIRQERDTRSKAALAVDPEWAAERHFGWVDALDWTSALIGEPATEAGQ